VKLTKKLETLETSRLLDISGDVTAFEPSKEGWVGLSKYSR